MTVPKAVYIFVGCLSVGLGAVGAFIPLLPTVPFLMLAAFCFAKSSVRLHTWFTGTGLYQNNLYSLLQGEGMPLRARLRVMAAVTLVMGAGFVLMRHVPVARAVLAGVWALHILYFSVFVKRKR